MTTKQDRKYAERYLKAADVIEKVSPKYFDMYEFGVTNGYGTHACIAGHCSLDPWFRRRQFISDFNHFNELNPRNYYVWDEMIKNFFGPDCDPAFVVPEKYWGNLRLLTPKRAAKSIRKFVKDRYGLTSKDFRRP